MGGKCTTLNKTQTELDAETVTIEDNTTLANSIRSALKGDYNISLPGLLIGSTATAVANVAFDYQIGGIRYTKAAVAAGVAPGNDVIPQALYGAVALDIDAAGTVTIAEAAANAVGYASAVLAIAGIPAVVATKARMGTVTTTLSSGAFTFGTTDLDAVGTTTAYTDGQTANESIGAAVS
jgi:hypothetical protein